MSDLLQRIRDDWHFLIVAVTTAGIGINFLVHPGLLEDKSTYAFIVNILDDAVFSVPILLGGSIGVFLLESGSFAQYFWCFISSSG